MTSDAGVMLLGATDRKLGLMQAAAGCIADPRSPLLIKHGVVTNLMGPAKELYDDLYCQRCEAENRIKEAQVGLFATRTSCQHFQSNQLRMLLAALGYVLIERLRALALQGTALASAQVDTLRIKLLKLAAVVTRNTRRIRLYMASNWPSADIFAHAMRALRSP